MASAARLSLLLAAVLPAAMLSAAPSHGQDSTHSHDGDLTHSAYLESQGLINDAAAIERWLRDELAERGPEWTVETRNQNAAFFAFIFAVSGVTADALASLDAQGVDVIHGITGESRPFIEQALLADLVVIGDVVRSEPSTNAEDGFQVSDVVDVRRVLKGSLPVERGRSQQTVVLRRSETPRERDVIPVVGERYLLLLSGGMYDFYAARNRARRGVSADASDDGRYSVYRIYRMRDGRVTWANYSRDDTAGALEEIQRLDDMLRQSSP